VTSDRWHYFRYEHVHALGDSGMNSLCRLIIGFTGDLYKEPERGAEVCRACQRLLRGGR